MPAIIVPREHPKLTRGPGDRLRIVLEPIRDFKERGAYGQHHNVDDPTKRKVPDRYLFMDPLAAASMRALEKDFPDVFYHSDLFRNASGSKGRRHKNRARRVQLGKSDIYTGKLPGGSGHGFGQCLDHMVADNLRRTSLFLEEQFNKEEYDLVWRRYGWWCHRDGPEGDHKKGHEWWHFNYFGDDPERWLAHSRRKTSGGLEAKLQYMHGPFTLDVGGVDEHLEHLGFDQRKREDRIREFQKYWTLPMDGVAGPQTQRILLYVGAEFVDPDGNDLADVGQGFVFP